MNKSELVYIDQYDLLGINFYWNRRRQYGFTDKELIDVGISNDRVQVHQSIIEMLKCIDAQFQTKGLRLFVKEGYRPVALYKLIYQRKVAKDGMAEADRLFNMDSMPHSTGLSVDVALWDPEAERELFLRNSADGTDAIFVDYYKFGHSDQERWYQGMQEYIIDIMLYHGFRLGTKREYWHFDYNPNIEPNYDFGHRANRVFY